MYGNGSNPGTPGSHGNVDNVGNATDYQRAMHQSQNVHPGFPSNMGNAFGINPAFMRNMFPIPNANMAGAMRGMPVGPSGQGNIPNMNVVGMGGAAPPRGRGMPFFPTNNQPPNMQSGKRGQNQQSVNMNRQQNLNLGAANAPSPMVIPTLPPSMSKRLQDFPQAVPKQPAGGQSVPNTMMSPLEHLSVNQPSLASSQRKKNRPFDKHLPKSIQALIPESKTYMDLLEMEKRVDVLLTRKRLDYADISKQPKKQQRVLRVYISNYAGNQDAPSIPGAAVEQPNWTLRIEGRLLEQGIKRLNAPPLPKFTSFLRSAVVEVYRPVESEPDRPIPTKSVSELSHDIIGAAPQAEVADEMNVDGTEAASESTSILKEEHSGPPHKTEIIEWHNTRNVPDTDGFEIKRKGSENLNCRIFLYLSKHPEEYKLSEPLAELLGYTQAVKHDVLVSLWEYIKREKLSSSEDRRTIMKNAALQKLFSEHTEPSLTFLELPTLINSHLLPLDPIEIPYTISVARTYNVGPLAYDIDVDIPDTSSREPYEKFVVGNTAMQQQIQSLDKAISDLISQLNHSRLRRDFMLEFSKSPVDFVKTWIASQTRDLETLMGEHRLATKEIQSSDFYKQNWVKEAVLHYLRSLGK